MLTDRSILDALVDAGELVEWLPLDPRRPVHRVVMLRQQPLAWLSELKGGEQDAIEKIRQETVAGLSGFIEGTLPLDDCLKDIGGRLGVCEWKRLGPTPPGMRILGTLAAPDVFVGMMAFTRDQLPDKRRPGQGKGTLWRDLIQCCAGEQKRLFGEVAPVQLKDAVKAEDARDELIG